MTVVYEDQKIDYLWVPCWSTWPDHCDISTPNFMATIIRVYCFSHLSPLAEWGCITMFNTSLDMLDCWCRFTPSSTPTPSLMQQTWSHYQPKVPKSTKKTDFRGPGSVSSHPRFKPLCPVVVQGLRQTSTNYPIISIQNSRALTLTQI